MHPKKIAMRLGKIVNCKISWDDQTRDFYSVDASSYILKPAVVAFPRNERDIIMILRYATKNKISVTARGAGTGLVGSALGKGIILDMMHMNKIKVSPAYVEAGSGVLKGQLDKELEKRGRFLGPDPSVGPFCTIGGMIATNASGSHSLKYGSVIDNLIQVKIARSSGSMITLPNESSISRKILKLLKPEIQMRFPQVSKNSCGYRIDKIKAKSDLQKIIAGSEGTLGIIISAKLRTFCLPKEKLLTILAYKTMKNAVSEVPEILKLCPSAVEIIDRNIAKHVNARITRKPNCLLFVEFDENLAENKKNIQKLTSGKIIKMIADVRKIKQWWNFRNLALSYSLRSISKEETMLPAIEDATVPVEKLPVLLNVISKLASKYRMKVIVYGHAGNGNLHIRSILKKQNSHIIKKIASEFFVKVVTIGGSITGEHGDGLARSEFVKLQYGSEVYSIFKKIKKEFDPKNILNPDKVITRKTMITKNLSLSRL